MAWDVAWMMVAVVLAAAVGATMAAVMTRRAFGSRGAMAPRAMLSQAAQGSAALPLWPQAATNDTAAAETYAEAATLGDGAADDGGTANETHQADEIDKAGQADKTDKADKADKADEPNGSEADRDAFASIVAHDLRAPIRVVEGFTRIVKEDYAGVLDQVGLDHLDRILGATARMHGMIDALLTLSRLSSQPIDRLPVNLSQLAGYVVEDLRRQDPARAVEVEIEPDLLTAGDPTLLRTLLENLLGNAWKYTQNTAGARIGFVRDGCAADAFRVEDNGAGFDMRYADRLFGVFQRLHSASEFPGTGIGLASVQRIVHRHGGEIRAEGEPDRGARFHFSLPLAVIGEPRRAGRR